MKVLMLTVSAGSGHIKAAQAIKDYFSKHYDDIEIETVDTLKYINPIIDKLVVGSYLKSLKKTPILYAKLYQYAENEDALSNLSGIINELFSIKLKNLLREFSPDVILCTHPFPVEMLSILKKRGKTDIPVAAILTDYAPHSFWFYDYIDAYIIPNEDFIHSLIEKGIDKDSIYPFGIPVCDSFSKPVDKVEIRKNLGLDEDKLTLLLMGGGLGMGNIKDIFEAIAFSSLDVQTIAVTGSNIRVKNQLINIRDRSNKKNIILGYTNEVSSLMSASDMIITKPGGLTITECLIKGLPIIIASPIPGQEEKNSDYLLNSGIAARVRESENIIPLINQIVKSPTRLDFMKKSAAEKSKPHAAEDICNLLMELANKKSSD